MSYTYRNSTNTQQEKKERERKGRLTCAKCPIDVLKGDLETNSHGRYYRRCWSAKFVRLTLSKAEVRGEDGGETAAGRGGAGDGPEGFEESQFVRQKRQRGLGGRGRAAREG